MKFTVAYYIILLYATVIFKPLIPIAIDCWAHTFANAEHVTEVHMKYGNDHLKKELAETSNDNNSNNKDQNTIKSEETTPVHEIVQAQSHQYFSTEIQNNYSILTILKTPFIFIAKNIPPPK